MFAVIKTGGKQYRVEPEDVLTVERLAGEAGDTVTLDHVLMVDSTIGTPTVGGASVAAEILEQTRGKKVISFKKRRRQNSKRTKGHRQDLSKIRIAEILTDGKAPSKAAKTSAKAQKADSTPMPAAAEPMFTPPQEADDLTALRGVGPKAAEQLNEQGITTFAQIAALTDDDIARIDANMPFSASQIEDWRSQAAEKA